MSLSSIYILTNNDSVFYVGSTNNLEQRWAAHKSRYKGCEMTEIDRVEIEFRFHWEGFYISLFRSWGFNLINRAKLKKFNPSKAEENMVAAQERFLMDKYISDFNKKKKTEITKENIAGLCGVNTKTIENWADRTQGGMPGLRKSKILADHLGCNLDQFLLKYTEYKKA